LEIQASSHQDITEFSDLISVAFSFAQENGFKYEDLMSEILLKSSEKGKYSRVALNNLNPENPSNKLYFSPDPSELLKEAVGLLEELLPYAEQREDQFNDPAIMKAKEFLSKIKGV
jgi:hypothetical protein